MYTLTSVPTTAPLALVDLGVAAPFTGVCGTITHENTSTHTHTHTHTHADKHTHTNTHKHTHTHTLIGGSMSFGTFSSLTGDVATIGAVALAANAEIVGRVLSDVYFELI
jgi:ABC-type Zn2+ transport system substrate-binding protein/surface adhesin